MGGAVSSDVAERQPVVDRLDGRSLSAGTLFPAVYTELRRLAHHYLARERPGHTLQATALVHEVYLRLVPHGDSSWGDRQRFVSIAAHVMREVLIEHARSRSRLKRGGDRKRVWGPPEISVIDEGFGRWEDLDRALNRLAALDSRQASVVELRYFGGLTVEETATVLEVSAKTVKRDWSVARAWLRRELDM
jgi:RNA polymerase sigma-70 factor, ECF subfamily